MKRTTDKLACTRGVAIIQAAILWYEAIQDGDDKALDIATHALMKTVPAYQRAKKETPQPDVELLPDSELFLDFLQYPDGKR